MKQSKPITLDAKININCNDYGTHIFINSDEVFKISGDTRVYSFDENPEEILNFDIDEFNTENLSGEKILYSQQELEIIKSAIKDFLYK